MKNRSILAFLVVAIMLFAMVGNVASAEVFPGKIAIFSSPIDQNEEEYRAAEQIVAKYGADKILHATYPANFMAEAEQIVTTMLTLGSDPDVGVIVINQAVPGMLNAVDKLKEIRDDIFIVFGNPQENAPDISARVNLALNPNTPARGFTAVQTAYDMGAKTFIHYSFPRHMSQPMNAARMDNMAAKCAELGMKFFTFTAPDPTAEGGLAATQQYMYEDIPKIIQYYGEDTVIFSTNCGMQTPLITSVVDLGAMYAEPCCASPLHGFPIALGIEVELGNVDLNWVIDETSRILAEKDMTGRMGNWPVPMAFLYTHVGVEYGIRYLNGEVAFDTVDRDVLSECVSNYIMEAVGREVEVSLKSYHEPFGATENFDVELDNFIWILVESIIY
ncbi:MAG: DUF3798 domain-containing protein [Clostridia bacterium]|nr:DUF3798 domain-containing protein [Clostridia bacterium]